MTIFVERLLARFNSNVVEQIHCHDWLPLVAVVSSLNNGQISVFRDVRPTKSLFMYRFEFPADGAKVS